MNIISLSNQPNNTINNRINPIKTRTQNYNSLGNSISFGSAKSDKAIKLLDNAIDKLIKGSEFNILNKMKFHKLLKEALPSIIQPENYINRGRESKVYRISDKYVAKIRRGHYENNSVRPYNITTLPSKKFKKLDFYYGEPVAKLGNVEILKNATPNENSVHCGAVFHYDGRNSSEELRYYTETYIPTCSKVPQESFDNLAKNLKILNKISARNILGQRRSYVPDIINPNNLLISNGKFVLVDKLEKVNFKNPNSIYTMLEPMLVRLTPERDAGKDAKLMKERVNIYKKILLAAEKHELPLESPIKYEYSDWVLADVIGKYDILGKVVNLRKSNVPKEKRIAAINKFFEDHPVK